MSDNLKKKTTIESLLTVNDAQIYTFSFVLKQNYRQKSIYNARPQN